MSRARAIATAALLAASAAALPLGARNFANVADRWTHIGTTPESAIFMLVSEGQDGDTRSYSLSLFFFSPNARPEVRNYRNARGAASLDCSKGQASLVFNRGVRLDGQVDEVSLPPDLNPQSGKDLQAAVLALGCGKVRMPDEKLATLRAWEAAVAYALRDGGNLVRRDPDLPERCAALHRSTSANPYFGTSYDIYVTRELDFQTVHPGKAFAAYVQGKTGAKDDEVECDLVDPDKPETEAQWLERVFGDDARRGKVVDNSWRP